MNKLILTSIFFLGSLLHISFGQLNEVLKVADSFAYFQMTEYLQDFSTNGFGTGWFGFLYSLPIAIFDFFLNNHFLSARLINIFLFNISGILLYKIAAKYLEKKYLYLLLILFFLSPVLLHFNIAILSENIYIPLFLSVALLAQSFLEKPKIIHAILFALLIAFMYLTRGEAFIYVGSVGLLSIFAYLKTGHPQGVPLQKNSGYPQEVSLQNIPLLRKEGLGVVNKKNKIYLWLSFNILLILSFFLFISPYIYHLHTITGDWGLSNKGSSNLRQATLRGKETMDDAGFEKAVAELTDDKKHLIAGFAGGLKYNTPQTELGLKSYILADPNRFINNWFQNQLKLYSQNLPHIILSDAGKLYFNSGSELFYKNKLFLLTIILPLLFFIAGIIQLIRNRKYDILIILGSFFFTAATFFTLFFTLNRYFIIFLPLFLIVIVYGIQNINSLITFTWTGFSKTKLSQNTLCGKNVFKTLCALACIGIYSLGLFSYYNSHKSDDDKHLIKKEAGEWLKENSSTYLSPLSISPNGREVATESDKNISSLSIRQGELIGKIKRGHSGVEVPEEGGGGVIKNINILERFPIVTYYSGTQHRWITPYTDSLTDLLTYAHYNNIHFLIVDSLDFKKYRPGLEFLLDETKKFEGLEAIKIFTKDFNGQEQKVIIYEIE